MFKRALIVGLLIVGFYTIFAAPAALQAVDSITDRANMVLEEIE